MTEVPIIKHNLPANGGRPLAIIPSDLDSVLRLSRAISLSGMAPGDLKTPEQIMVAIMHGAEVGLTPMMAIQRIAVIGGRATIWGDAALGLVISNPLCDDIEESFEGEGDTKVAVCSVRRRGKEKPVVRKFSVADAKTAGLWGKSGPWKNYPDRMLQMRARGFALRDAFPDVLGGLYLREEVEEDQPRAVSILEPPAPPPMIEHAPPEPDPPEPDPPAPEPPEPDTPPDPDGASPAKLTADEEAEIVARYTDAAAAAAVKDSDALDAAWNDIIVPIQDQLSRDTWEACAAIDDKNRSRIE